MTATDASDLYLEDFKVGQRYESRETYELTQDRAVAFAQEFDPQPFHINPEAAKDSLFNGLAASGWMTCAITMRLLTSSLDIAGGIVGAGGEIAWPSSARPGQVLRATSEVVDIQPSRSRPDRGRITIRTETKDQDGSVVEILTAHLIVMRRSARDRPSLSSPRREERASPN
jgi:acyl dehydratase